MLQDIKIQKIPKVLFASESIIGILGGTLLSGPIDTEILIFNLKHSLLEV